MKRITISGLAILLALCLVAPAMAQSKTDKCGNVRIVVDVKSGSSWSDNALELALLKDGGGWVNVHTGKNVAAKKGQKLRFNFNDGQSHKVNVTASSSSDAVNVSGGSTAAIVLVDVTGSGQAAVHFEVTGADNPKAKEKVSGCPGGNFYLEIE